MEIGFIVFPIFLFIGQVRHDFHGIALASYCGSVIWVRYGTNVGYKVCV